MDSAGERGVALQESHELMLVNNKFAAEPRSRRAQRAHAATPRCVVFIFNSEGSVVEMDSLRPNPIVHGGFIGQDGDFAGALGDLFRRRGVEDFAVWRIVGDQESAHRRQVQLHREHMERCGEPAVKAAHKRRYVRAFGAQEAAVKRMKRYTTEHEEMLNIKKRMDMKRSFTQTFGGGSSGL